MEFKTQEDIINSVPSYLHQFIVEQDYSRYTPQDHAVWRYIMHRNVSFLKDKAHKAYMDGLKQTGITLDYIPNIVEMNHALGKLGWRAVVVDGFVPPAAFMEFQALKILVISAEMRNINNILYTPAPDIVHEAAGHAPIIAEPAYSEYLRKFGEYGMKSVFSKEDYEIYEAIRYLSIIKEYPDTPKDEIKAAEEDLDKKMNANTTPSEANLLSRMHWWTVEYGLSGNTDSFKIFGAGLLSSVGESKHCMDDEVIKLPLTKDCVNFTYDITTMQPQLFVAKDFNHLTDVLEEFADEMCFRKGGVSSLNMLIESRQVGTVVLETGLQISGKFIELETDRSGNLSFIKIEGETSLALDDKEIEGHGVNYHTHGFSSILGNLKGINKTLNECDQDDLDKLNIQIDKEINLEFENGFQLQGTLKRILFNNQNEPIILNFEDCTVKKDNKFYFKPEWGIYDMAIGSEIISAYSGSADKVNFDVYPPKSERKAIPINYTDEQKFLFSLYQRIRNTRENDDFLNEEVFDVYQILKDEYPQEWLLRWEILEILEQYDKNHKLIKILHDELLQLREVNETYHNVISGGLSMLQAESN